MNAMRNLFTRLGFGSKKRNEHEPLSATPAEKISYKFKRAANICNAIGLGICAFCEQKDKESFCSTNSDPSSNSRIILLAGLANYILAADIDRQVEMLKASGVNDGRKKIIAKAEEILNEDINLDKFVFRTLYELLSTGIIVNSQATVFRHKPRIMEVISKGKEKYPYLTQDFEETEFKKLADIFAQKYLPDMQTLINAMF